MKLCNRCQQTYPLANFHTDKSRKDGLHAYCKTCITEYRRAYRATGRNNTGNEQLREDMGKLKHIQSMLTRAWA